MYGDKDISRNINNHRSFSKYFINIYEDYVTFSFFHDKRESLKNTLRLQTLWLSLNKPSMQSLILSLSLISSLKENRYKGKPGTI